MFKQMMAGATLLGLAACSSPAEIGDQVLVADAEAAELAPPSPPTPPVPPEPGEDGGVSFNDNSEQDGGTREFSYSWPAEVSAIPALAKELEARRDRDLAGQKTDWAQAMSDCPEGMTSCRSNAYEMTWQVVADTPRFLSLSNSLYTYGGGAHGNYWRGGHVWDREAKVKALQDAKSLFISGDALDAAIGKRVCDMLNAERAKRRGGPVTEGNWPNQCVAMEDETVVFLGSTNGKTFDRIGIYYAPYIAGPYAEGEFEFTVPVTKRVIAAVKPEYRGAFSTM